MIKRSKDAGCWAAKFQIFTRKEAPNLSKKYYLSFESAKELFDYGKEIGQNVFFTPMYLKAVRMCSEIGCSHVKIRFKDRTNYNLIREALNYFVEDTIFISDNLTNSLTLNVNYLFCVSRYPASVYDYLREIWDVLFFSGLSDHTSTMELLKFGKDHNFHYFEKHVKLSKTTLFENPWCVDFKTLKEAIKD